MPFESKAAPIDLTDQSITDFLFPILDAKGQDVAFTDGNLTVTNADVKAQSIAVSSYLTKKGMVKGDTVCIYSENHVYFTSVFLGCAKAGIVVSTASKDLQAREVALQLADCKAKVLFTTTDKKDTVTAIQSQYEGLEEVVLLNALENSSEATAVTSVFADDGTSAPDTEINSREDLLCLPYSSGTTGLPKGVMLTHFNVVNNVIQANSSLTFQESNVFVAVLPFTHIYGLVLLSIGALAVNAKTVVMSKFDPGKFLGIIAAHGVTCLHIVPPIVLFLAKHPVVANFDLSSVTMAVCGAAPLGAEVGALLQTRFPSIDLLQGYGMTELSPVATISPANNSKLASCGVLIPNTQAKIIDSEGQEVKQGERGELCIKGPQVMKGYYNNSSATAHTIDQEGWLHTGDVAFVDEEGYIYVVDRVKELIKYKGFQVAPAELEALLLGHSSIADVAVIGLSDEKAGELPLAFIVKAAEALTEDDVKQFLVDQGIAHYKQLRGGVRFLEKIPKSGSGKILRRLLRDQVRAEQAESKSSSA